MRARGWTVVGLWLVVIFSTVSEAAAYSGLATKVLCGLGSCHTHPGFVTFAEWHASHQVPEVGIPCEGCHPNNHTTTGPLSAPEATYSLAEACSLCHPASTVSAPQHLAAGLADCVGCHPPAGTLTGTVYGPLGPLAGVVVSVDEATSTVTFADGSYAFARLPAGTHQLTFEKPGYETVEMGSIEIANGQTTSRYVTLAPVWLTTSVGLIVSPPVPSYGGQVTLDAMATASGTVPVGLLVYFERWTGAAWQPIDAARVGLDGHARAIAGGLVTRQTFRVRLAQSVPFLGSSSSGVSVKPRAYVGTPVAPLLAYRGRGFAVYGYLKPRHPSGTCSVRIYRYRYVSGAWKPYGYSVLRVDNYGTYSRYAGTISLPYAGRWRLRAYHPTDGGHTATWSSGFDYVTVR